MTPSLGSSSRGAATMGARRKTVAGSIPDPASRETKSSRHTWSPHPYRPDEHHTHRCCLKCGIVKTTRKENDNGKPIYWIEFHDTDGNRIRTEGDRTPKCEPQEILA